MRSISFAATATATALAAATAGVGLLVTAPGASSADATRSSAYGIQVSGGGQVVVPPTPSVESTDGTDKTAGGGSLPPNQLGLSAGVAELSAGDDTASVELADLGLAPDSRQIPAEVRGALQETLGELQAGCDALTEEVPDPPAQEEEEQEEGPAEDEQDAPRAGALPLPEEFDPFRDLLTELLGGFEVGDLEDFCDSFDIDASIVTIDGVDVSCTGDTGAVRLQDVTLLGQTVPLQPSEVEPNTVVLPDNPLLTITANQQTQDADGTFSVDGLNVKLGDGEAEAILANATCGEPIAAPAADPAPPAAPAPAPVTTSAPVTG